MVTQGNVFTVCTLQTKINAFSGKKFIFKTLLVLVEPQTIFHGYNTELNEEIIFKKSKNYHILIIFKPIHQVDMSARFHSTGTQTAHLPISDDFQSQELSSGCALF